MFSSPRQEPGIHQGSLLMGPSDQDTLFEAENTWTDMYPQKATLSTCTRMCGADNGEDTRLRSK